MSEEKKAITLNKDSYVVQNHEFQPLMIEEYCNLNMLHDLGNLERLAGFIKELTLVFEKPKKMLFLDLTHGGFLAKECKSAYDKLVVVGKNASHQENLIVNLSEDKNIVLYSNLDELMNHKDGPPECFNVVFSESQVNMDCVENLDSVIIISKTTEALDKAYPHKFKFANTQEKVSSPFTLCDYTIYVPEKYIEGFYREFGYFLDPSLPGVLFYNNLIHYTMIVKNAGEMFEEVLTKNLPFIDKWTILDTGSTDNTVEIIKKVLIGKKKGNLYQEPFINFRDSRNRCLDLASESVEPCKYLMMLDDTYIIEGSLREFLDTTRGDQFSDSFSLFVKSDDMVYASNRITKTKNKLRYIFTMHEVIQDNDNICVCVYLKDTWIFDKRAEYMEERTMERKKYDLEKLFEMIEDDPGVSRHLYYIAQTYSLMGEHEKALEYFIKRAEHPNKGFVQERVDSYFEAARLCNFKLNKDWETCKAFYEKSYELDKKKPDCLYFIGIHYIVSDDKNPKLAYEYMKKAYDCGFPEGSQHSLKPTLYYHFLPRYLIPLCYAFADYETGYKASVTYLENDINKSGTYNIAPDYKEQYTIINNWHNIFVHLLRLPKIDINMKISPIDKPYLVMIVPGNWDKWTGRDILTKGLGGSETCMVELARHMKTHKVIFFCNCSSRELFQDVEFRDLSEIYSFISYNVIDTVIVSRYLEYLPMVLTSNSINKVFLINHDLMQNNTIVVGNEKLKGILCLTEWHCNQFSNIYTGFDDKLIPFNYGIDVSMFKSITNNFNFQKIPNRFIYSSFANRGLLSLLQMWPKIVERYPSATLELFCDLNHKWLNEVYKQGIEIIKSLINNYHNMFPGTIIYRGWQSKAELYKGMANAEYFFYPTNFQETFCLTALEAQICKTLCVCTDLAALKNTVSYRGVLLPEGNVYSEEWQDIALNELFRIMADSERKQEIVDEAFRYASTRTWESRTRTLEYLIRYK